MTGPNDVQQPDDPTTLPTNAMILIDDWPDGMVEETAWVEVTTEVASPEEAIAYLERFFPCGDLEDGMRYACHAKQVWQAPDQQWREEHGIEDDDGEGPWKVVDPTAEAVEDAKLFWVVEVEEDV